MRLMRPLLPCLLLPCLVAAPLWAEPTLFPAPSGQTGRSGGQVVVVYSSLDERLAQPLIAGFQGEYPDISVRYEDLLTAEIAERVQAETAAGGATADLVFSSAMDLGMKLANDGFARPAPVPEAADWPRWANWRDTVFALTFEPGVIVYHRPTFPDGPPDTRAELIGWLGGAEPGRIGTYDIARSAVGYLYFSRDQEHFADLWQLVQAMGQAGVQTFPTSQDIIDRVNRGDLALGYNILGSYADEQADRLGDLGVALPQDFVVVLSRVALVPRNAASPDLGEALLSFLMSPRGQRLLSEQLRLPAISPDVRGPDSAEGMLAEHGSLLQPVPVSPGLLAYLDPANRARVLARWQAAVSPAPWLSPRPTCTTCQVRDRLP